MRKQKNTDEEKKEKYLFNGKSWRGDFSKPPPPSSLLHWLGNNNTSYIVFLQKNRRQCDSTPKTTIWKPFQTCRLCNLSICFPINWVVSRFQIWWSENKCISSIVYDVTCCWIIYRHYFMMSVMQFCHLLCSQFFRWQSSRDAISVLDLIECKSNFFWIFFFAAD